MKTILIADDSEGLRLLVRDTLDNPEYHIVEARDGTEALHIIRDTPPDLVILDWMMPSLNGIDVLSTLRADPGTTDLPVIMLTGMSAKDEQALATALGAVAYLTKPFSPLALIDLVENALGPDS